MIVRRTYKAATIVLGGQQLVNLDYLKIPFQVGVLLDLVSGTINYSVEFTTDSLDGPFDPTTMRWITTQEFPQGSSGTIQATLNEPMTALRLNIQSMTGEARLSVIQGIGV